MIQQIEVIETDGSEKAVMLWYVALLVDPLDMH